MMHISSDIAFRHSLCRPFMLLLACVLSLAVWPPLRAQEKPVGKHIGKVTHTTIKSPKDDEVDILINGQLHHLVLKAGITTQL